MYIARINDQYYATTAHRNIDDAFDRVYENDEIDLKLSNKHSTKDTCEI